MQPYDNEKKKWPGFRQGRLEGIEKNRPIE
jgi:hypothetical protein